MTSNAQPDAQSDAGTPSPDTKAKDEKSSPESPPPAAAPEPPASASEKDAPPMLPVISRGIFGGLLMGLANLVPGISGGTMLLASGVYRHFVDAIAELTRLKFRLKSLAVLGTIAAAAGVAILIFAGPVKTLVVEHRWVMYSLFIGLTLGGVPVLWRLIGKGTRSVWTGAALGFAAMLALAWFQMKGAGEGASGDVSWPMFIVGGVLGASAMVLPGISGGYLLLLLGQYVPLLGAIDLFKVNLLSGRISEAMSPAIQVLLPVGIGVLLGVAGVSSLLKFLFARFEKPTLGVLLGFLVGAVFGLWPFQQGVRPSPGFWFKGKQLMTPEEIDAVRANWPTEYFTPSVLQIAGALGLIAAGFCVTLLVGRLGNGSSEPSSAQGTQTGA